ncbi:unnamed protein product [Ixodes pacificus]
MSGNSMKSVLSERKLRQLSRRGIGHQLHYVSKYLKPSYLWDLSEPAVATVDECIRRFNDSFNTGHLRSVQIGDCDLLVCNPELTLQHLKDVVFSNNVRFVDVSSTQRRPTLLSTLPPDLEVMLRCLLRQLDRFSLEDRKLLRLDLKSGWNMCSAFGVFLGFPVVYWCSVESDSNCLSMEELKAFSVRCPKLYDGTENLDPGASNEVYSFSFPLRLEPELRGHVRCWFERLRTRFADLELTMTSRVCCYPTVAL